MDNEDIKKSINRGLDGVVIANTTISNIDGKRGQLVYAGHSLEDLINNNYSYEDVVHLFLKGSLPTPEESKLFAKDLARRRELSNELKQLIAAIPKTIEYMDAFRIGMSALGCEMNVDYPPTEEQALNCIAKAPIILSYYYRLRTGQTFLGPREQYSHAANYLYLLTGKTTDTPIGAAHAKALNSYLITTMEHGINASTFAARVSTSTQSDLVSSIAAALSTLKGPLHGGAPLEVMHMLDEIATKERTEEWIHNKLKNNEPLMGFGHRVYKTYDPRATVLLQVLDNMPKEDTNISLEFIKHVQDVAIRLLNEYKPGRNLYPNVEFGVAGVLRAIGVPEDLYTATFAVSRCAGWVTHIIEQSKDNRLMRPTAHYSGLLPQSFLEKKAASQAISPIDDEAMPKINNPSFFSRSTNGSEHILDDRNNVSATSFSRT